MKRFVVRDPKALLCVEAPERFAAADEIEIRVSLTPLRWDQRREKLDPCDVTVYSEVRFVRVGATDSRMVFALVRDLIRSLVREYLGVDI